MDFARAIIEAIDKLNRTDGEAMAIATTLQDAAESAGITRGCEGCGGAVAKPYTRCGDAYCEEE